MLEILMHANVRKVNGVFTARVRTKEAGVLVAKRSADKGIPIIIELVPPPRYFESQRAHFEHLINTNENFAYAVKELGITL